jgi:nitrogen regulatory protein PII
MLLDLPRVEYNSKNRVKKSDLEFVKEQNKKAGTGKLTMAEIMGEGKK